MSTYSIKYYSSHEDSFSTYDIDMYKNFKEILSFREYIDVIKLADEIPCVKNKLEELKILLTLYKDNLND